MAILGFVQIDKGDDAHDLLECVHPGWLSSHEVTCCWTKGISSRCAASMAFSISPSLMQFTTFRHSRSNRIYSNRSPFRTPLNECRREIASSILLLLMRFFT